MNAYDPAIPETVTMPGATLEFDDERVVFRLDAVSWRDGATSGTWTIPPCLRTARAHVEVEAEVIKLSRPSDHSGAYTDWQVLDVTCPSS